MPVPAKKKQIALMPNGQNFPCVIGIFAHRGLPDEQQPFGSQTVFFADFLQHAPQFGVFLFVFSPDDVSKAGDSQQWYGWIVQSDGQWIRKIVPKPDVIYDRILFVNRDLADCARAVRALLHAQKFVFMNDPLFAQLSADKWKFFLFAKKDPALQQFSSETILFHLDEEEFFLQYEEFFARFADFVVKPRFGYKGKGVIRLHVNHGRYFYDYTLPRASAFVQKKGILPSLKELSQLIRELLYSYKFYIIQPLIRGTRFRERFFDVRIVFQRRHHAGIWHTTFMACRVAPLNSVASNLSSGGSPFLLETVLKECFDESLDTPSGIAFRLQELGRVLCDAIAKHFSINEFAADIMIDENRALWLLEINAKPDCGILRSLKEDTILTALFSNICSYASSLR